MKLFIEIFKYKYVVNYEMNGIVHNIVSCEIDDYNEICLQSYSTVNTVHGIKIFGYVYVKMSEFHKFIKNSCNLKFALLNYKHYYLKYENIKDYWNIRVNCKEENIELIEV